MVWILGMLPLVFLALLILGAATGRVSVTSVLRGRRCFQGPSHAGCVRGGRPGASQAKRRGVRANPSALSPVPYGGVVTPTG